MRDINDLTILILPGLGGAGPDHWQTAWGTAFPGMQRVEQANWEKPVYPDWSARLTEAVARAMRPIVLVAHSLGTSLTMRWSFEQPEHAKKVAGAFLAAPTDRDRCLDTHADVSPTGPVVDGGSTPSERLPECDSSRLSTSPARRRIEKRVISLAGITAPAHLRRRASAQPVVNGTEKPATPPA